MEKTNKEKMLAGEPFCSLDPDLLVEIRRARRLTRLINATTEEQETEREALIRQLFGKVGSKVAINPPFTCDLGYNIHVGENFFANYDCTILDHGGVYIGDNCMLAPKVCIYTIGHPEEPEGRAVSTAYCKPVHIGNDVWVGGSAIILPGVTVGNNVIIAAGSIVTKNIPDNVVVGGNPAKIIKELHPEK